MLAPALARGFGKYLGLPTCTRNALPGCEKPYACGRLAVQTLPLPFYLPTSTNPSWLHLGERTWLSRRRWRFRSPLTQLPNCCVFSHQDRRSMSWGTYKYCHVLCIPPLPAVFLSDTATTNQLWRLAVPLQWFDQLSLPGDKGRLKVAHYRGWPAYWRY